MLICKSYAGAAIAAAFLPSAALWTFQAKQLEVEAMQLEAMVG